MTASSFVRARGGSYYVSVSMKSLLPVYRGAYQPHPHETDVTWGFRTVLNSRRPVR